MPFLIERLEIPRRLFHVSGLVLIFLPAIFPDYFRTCLFSAAFFFALFDFLRIKTGLVGPFGILLRREERKRFSGTFYYLWGIALASLAGPGAFKEGLAVLAVADPLAGIVYSFKGRKHPSGSVAFFLVSVFVLILLGRNPCEALVIAGIAALAERFSPADDNLVIPPAVALAGIGTSVFRAFPCW